MKTNDTSRREFISATLLAGLAVTGCSSGKNPFEPDAATIETVKVFFYKFNQIYFFLVT